MNTKKWKDARLCYERAQLLTEPYQAGCFVGAGAVHLPFKTRVNKFKMEDGSREAACLRG
jgi:hypothetical protein